MDPQEPFPLELTGIYTPEDFQNFLKKLDDALKSVKTRSHFSFIVGNSAVNPLKHAIGLFPSSFFFFSFLFSYFLAVCLIIYSFVCSFGFTFCFFITAKCNTEKENKEIAKQGLYWKSGLYLNGMRLVSGKHVARLKYYGKVRVKYEDLHPEAPKIVPRISIVN